MPSIEPRRSANGMITSYRITVSAGYDYLGKQIRRRSIWIPPRHGMTERQMEKEATAAAYKFEEMVNNGYIPGEFPETCFLVTRSMRLRIRRRIILLWERIFLPTLIQVKHRKS